MVSVEQVIRIERQNDTHTIANKTFDLSRATIRQLMREGYEETLEQEADLLQVSGTRSTQDNLTKSIGLSAP